MVEQGWRSFLIRVENPGGLTLPLTSISDAATDEGDLNQQYTVSREPMLNLGNLADLLTDAGPGTDDLALRSQLSMIVKCRVQASASNVAKRFFSHSLLKHFALNRDRRNGHYQGLDLATEIPRTSGFPPTAQ